ncbi:hypothetical protein VTK56DRAFT_4944 [Thermocarpiscus australiensis]
MGWHWSIIGMGGSAFITCTDGKTVLEGQDVWENGRHCASFEFPSEEGIVREEAICKLLGDHPQILKCFGLEEIHPGVRALRLQLAPLGDLRRYIEKHPNDPHRSRRALAWFSMSLSGSRTYTPAEFGIRISPPEICSCSPTSASRSATSAARSPSPWATTAGPLRTRTTNCRLGGGILESVREISESSLRWARPCTRFCRGPASFLVLVRRRWTSD